MQQNALILLLEVWGILRENNLKTRDSLSSVFLYHKFVILGLQDHLR